MSSASAAIATYRPARTPVWRLALAGLCYGVGWQLLLPLSHSLWFLPAGLRLGFLWLTPSRYWPWLVLGEWTGATALAISRQEPLLSWDFVGMNLVPMLAYIAVMSILRGGESDRRIATPRRMFMLLGTGMLSAAVVSPILSYFQPADGVPQSSWAGTFAFMYGDFIGHLVLAPVMVLFWQRDWRQRLTGALWRDLLLQLLFSLALLMVLYHRADLSPYLLLLAFAPIFYAGFRHGWEGAALSVMLTGMVVEALAQNAPMPVAVILLQLMLAVIGVGGLILGTAVSELRRSHADLHQRHREMSQLNQHLTRTADELRSVSQRLVRLQEQGQRELAGELDYELGQAIHALGTHVSLAFRDVRDEQTLRLLESMREQVREMQESLRLVLRRLRPQMLDTHGLREAIGAGPLRDALEDAGITFEASFYGNIDLLGDDAQTAAYRICQAAVAEATHLESTREVRLKLSVQPGTAQRVLVEMQIDMLATPFLEMPIEPHPLPVISDRVLALDGIYITEALTPGMRHRISFEQALPDRW